MVCVGAHAHAGYFAVDFGTAGQGVFHFLKHEDAGTLAEVYEPFLIKEGFIRRTPRGREVTELAYTHLGLSPYTGRAYDPKQPTLF